MKYGVDRHPGQTDKIVRSLHRPMLLICAVGARTNFFTRFAFKAPDDSRRSVFIWLQQRLDVLSESPSRSTIVMDHLYVVVSSCSLPKWLYPLVWTRRCLSIHALRCSTRRHSCEVRVSSSFAIFVCFSYCQTWRCAWSARFVLALVSGTS